jgi:hypothetical protein
MIAREKRVEKTTNSTPSPSLNGIGHISETARVEGNSGVFLCHATAAVQLCLVEMSYRRVWKALVMASNALVVD